MRLVTLILTALLTLSACNTVQGVGQDVQGAGELLESGASSVQRAVN